MKKSFDLILSESTFIHVFPVNHSGLTSLLSVEPLMFDLFMIIFIKIICIVLAIAIIALVLLQQGKGSDLGSAFGGGSSNSMFGALGPSDFLGKLTYALVATWLVLSLALAYMYKTQNTATVFDTQLIEEAVIESSSNDIPVE